MYPRLRGLIILALCALGAVVNAEPGPPASVVMVAGNGQVVEESFLTTIPLTIKVTDASGVPVSGVSVSWALTQNSTAGGLNGPTSVTDSNGIATAGFLGGTVQPGNSYNTTVVTATTIVGSINFYETVVPVRLPNGNQAQPPYIQLNSPTTDNPVVTGPAGGTVSAGVVLTVVAQGGLAQGLGIPNVGVRIVNSDGSTGPVPASCNAQAGIVLTTNSGVATCDLILGNTPGTYSITALVGEYQTTRRFTLVITPGQACSYTITPIVQSFSVGGGVGTVNVTTAGACTWTAISNAPSFITITGGASGAGNGTVTYSVGINNGVGRTGTLSIAGQTLTVSQNGVGTGTQLSITSNSTLPGGITNQPYSANLLATGGTPPYTWAVTAGSLPAGLTLTPSTGIITGHPVTNGTYTFTATVTDSASGQQSQSFTIIVVVAGSGGLTIGNTSFPAGTVGAPYPTQVLSYTATTCLSPFSPPPVFTLTAGILPPGLSIQSNGAGYSIVGTPTGAGVFNFTLGASDSCGEVASASFSITINGSGSTTSLTATPATVTLNAAQNGTTVLNQQVQLTSTGTSVIFSMTPATFLGGNWLAVTTNSGATPATLSLAVSNYQNLAPGTYQGAVTVSGGNGTLSIPVNLVIAPNNLAITPASMTFSLPANVTSQQLLSVLSTNGALAFTATSQTQTGSNWVTLGAASGTTPTNLPVNLSTAGLTVGQYTGSITIAAAASGSKTIPLTLNVIPTTLTVDLTSAIFTAMANGPAPPTQSINLISSGGPVPVTVTTSTTNGGSWLAATIPTGATATAVTASANPAGLAPGTYSGTITITPQDSTIAVIRIPAKLTVTPGTGPVLNNVVNSATLNPGPVAPGEIITIFGTGLGPTTPALLTLTSSNMVSTTLAGTQVLFDGQAAPLWYVSATQINVIVPYEVNGKVATSMQVSYNNVLSPAVQLGVAATAPGIYLNPGSAAPAQAAALNQDYALNSSSNGAVPGSVVTLYATGEGQTNPPSVTGSVTGNNPPNDTGVVVRIGGLPATLQFAGPAPGLVAGAVQVNAVVPLTVPRGTQVSVTITIGDVTSNTATIAIAP